MGPATNINADKGACTPTERDPSAFSPPSPPFPPSSHFVFLAKFTGITLSLQIKGQVLVQGRPAG